MKYLNCPSFHSATHSISTSKQTQHNLDTMLATQGWLTSTFRSSYIGTGFVSQQKMLLIDTIFDSRQWIFAFIQTFRIWKAECSIERTIDWRAIDCFGRSDIWLQFGWNLIFNQITSEKIIQRCIAGDIKTYVQVVVLPLRSWIASIGCVWYVNIVIVFIVLVRVVDTYFLWIEEGWSVAHWSPNIEHTFPIYKVATIVDQFVFSISIVCLHTYPRQCIYCLWHFCTLLSSQCWQMRCWQARGHLAGTKHRTSVPESGIQLQMERESKCLNRKNSQTWKEGRRCQANDDYQQIQLEVTHCDSFANEDVLQFLFYTGFDQS